MGESPVSIDAVSRRTSEAISRRGSLLTLGGAALAALIAMPRGASADKSRKSKNENRRGKQKKQAKKQVLQLCRKQVGECQTFLTAACEGAGCGTVVAVCCPLLGTCQNEAFFTCLVDSLNPA